MSLIWPSQRIARAISDGIIVTATPVEADQIQPASLDMRLGPLAYRLPASFLPGPGRTVADRLADLSTHAMDLTTPTVLERNCVHKRSSLARLKLPRWSPTTPPSANCARITPDSRSGLRPRRAGGAGSRIVLEVRSHDVPLLLDHGQRVATLEYEPMAERPDRLYGETMRSNYQGQGLKLSKHFA